LSVELYKAFVFDIYIENSMIFICFSGRNKIEKEKKI